MGIVNLAATDYTCDNCGKVERLEWEDNDWGEMPDLPTWGFFSLPDPPRNPYPGTVAVCSRGCGLELAAKRINRLFDLKTEDTTP